MSINEKSYAYGAQKSSIREIAAYGAQRKAEIGAENVYDFSLGNPSIPAPDAVRASIERSLELPPAQLHGYTPAPGLPVAREAVAASLNRRFGTSYAAGDVYLTCGAAASLSISFNAVVNPGDEVIVPTAGSCGVAKARMNGEEGQMKCYDWFFCTKPLSKKEVESNLG